MKKTFTLSMSWLHTWSGVILGWPLFGILLTGSIAVFNYELTYWLTPEIHGDLPDRAQSLRVGEDYLQAHAPDSRLWRIVLPTTRQPALTVEWRAASGGSTTKQLDPRTGALINRETEGGAFFLHYHEGFHIDRNRNRIGLYMVGVVGLAMMIACISGIVIHKRILRDLFLFRPAASRQRSWLDAHNVLGVLALPFHLMMAFTGVVLLYWMFVPAAVQMLYSGNTPAFREQALQEQYSTVEGRPGAKASMTPLASLISAAETYIGAGKTAYVYVRDPNRADAVADVYRVRTDEVTQQVDQVVLSAVEGTAVVMPQLLAYRSAAVRAQSFTAALHWLEWGGPLVRWCYFLAGLAGAGVTATGLVIFTAKRRRAAPADTWPKIAEALNVAMVAGICVACVAYLWADRLTPLDIHHRAAIPMETFFWTWLAMAVHAAARPARRAWIEQWALTALLCLGAPLLQGLVIRDLQTADSVRLGIDATLIVFGLVFAAVAWTLATARSRASREPVSGSAHALGA